jgi:hypothetical protein
MEVTLLTLHLADNLAQRFRVPLRKPWEVALVRHQAKLYHLNLGSKIA